MLDLPDYRLEPPDDDEREGLCESCARWDECGQRHARKRRCDAWEGE